MSCGVPLALLKTMGRASSPRRATRWPDQATAPITDAARAVMAVFLKKPEWVRIAHLFIESNWAKVAAVEAESVVGGDHPYGPRKDRIRSCWHYRQWSAKCVFCVLLRVGEQSAVDGNAGVGDRDGITVSCGNGFEQRRVPVTATRALLPVLPAD